jgi:hypothetical protein
MINSDGERSAHITTIKFPCDVNDKHSGSNDERSRHQGGEPPQTRDIQVCGHVTRKSRDLSWKWEFVRADLLRLRYEEKVVSAVIGVDTRSDDTEDFRRNRSLDDV